MGIQIQKKIEALLGGYKTLNCKKNKPLVTPEKPISSVFYLKRGTVRMFAISKEGTEYTLNLFKAGSFFPLGPVFAKTSNVYYFAAVTDCTIIEVPRETFLYIFRHEPAIMEDLLIRIYRGLDGYFARMESLLAENASYKVVLQILQMTRRFGQPLTNSPGFRLKLTHKQLAELTGLTRETVTREIAKLQDEGLIQYVHKTLHILDIKKLEAEILVP